MGNGYNYREFNVRIVKGWTLQMGTFDHVTYATGAENHTCKKSIVNGSMRFLLEKGGFQPAVLDVHWIYQIFSTQTKF